MSSRTTSWAQRSRASACERRRIASSVRADVKPTVTSFSFASWRIATYSSTMYSDTSGVTLGSNWRTCETKARRRAGSTASTAGGCDSLRWTYTTCSASRLSVSQVERSRMSQRRSKRERRAAGRLMFSSGVFVGLYRE